MEHTKANRNHNQFKLSLTGFREGNKVTASIRDIGVESHATFTKARVEVRDLASERKWEEQR